MIVITGWRSRIAEEFRAMLPPGEFAKRGVATDSVFDLWADRYLFCQGLLRPKQMADQSAAEIAQGVLVNLTSIVKACDGIIAENDRARICVIGSESGYRGSFDGVYADAKRALHDYIESKRLRTVHQQLVGISPWIIGDAQMTTLRTDVDNLDCRRESHPKRRFLKSREVAAMAKFLLYGETDYVTGTIIRMHGGLQ